jgi:hypothetical protein
VRIGPISTLPLRASLRIERGKNAKELRRRSDGGTAPGAWTPPRNLLGLRVRIDPYPDLGHQLSTWIAGYLWSADLGVPYLGGEVTKDTKGLFDLAQLTAAAPSGNVLEHRLAATGFETDDWSLHALQETTSRAAPRSSRPWIGRLALDQRRWDQTPAAEPLRRAVLGGYLGDQLRSVESNADYIAVHARRGDIGPQSHPDRWIGLDYYRGLIDEIRSVPALNSMPIRLFTSGDAADLRDLERVGVMISDGGQRDQDFIEIAAARVVVAAPSSFGFLAALVSRAPVIARTPWWHHVPDSGRWLAYQADKGLDTTRLGRLVAGDPS